MRLTYTDPNFTFGRDRIYAYEPITPLSVVRVVKSAYQFHEKNQNDIEWLFKLYRGDDKRIIDRRRAINSSINYRAMVNMYAPIVDTKAGLLCQSPATLVNRSTDESVGKDIEELSRIYNITNIQPRDKQTATQVGVCGVAYRFIEVDNKYVPGEKNGHYPFKVSILNPANVFSIWADDTDSSPVAIVYMTQETKTTNGMSSYAGDITGEPFNYNLQTRFTVYTDNAVYTFTENDRDPVISPAMPWGIPIVERYANPYRIGFFERVQSLIFMRSVLRSDQITNVSDFINAIWLAVNIGLPEVDPKADANEKERQQREQDEFIERIRRLRMIWINDQNKDMPASLELKGQQLSQSETKVLDDTLRDDIIFIAKIPNYVAEIGGSGNTGAAQTSEGWTQALIDAIDQEPYWFEGARRELEIQLAICKRAGMLKNMTVEDVDFFIQRKTFDDKQSAAQVYVSLRQDNIPPGKAAEIANLVADTNNLEQLWRDFREEEEKRVQELAPPTLNTEGEAVNNAMAIQKEEVIV